MRIISKSPKETMIVAKAISRILKGSEIICLYGELGSGKTVFAKGLAEGLGIKQDKVVSPSFVLIREYHKARLPLYHFDLYRLKSPGDIVALGYEEYFFSDGLCVIEWPDRLGNLLPAEFIKVKIEVRGKNKRLISIDTRGDSYKELSGRISEIIRN